MCERKLLHRIGGPGLVFLRAGFSHSVSYCTCTSRPHIYSTSQSRHAQRKAKGGVDFSSRQLSAARLHLPPGQQKY